MQNQTFSSIITLPLRLAYICMDCQVVTNCQSDCPGCGARGSTLVPLLAGLQAIDCKVYTIEEGH